MARPFRFGVQVSNVGSGREWAELARRLEDLGYSTLFMPDHYDAQLGPLPAIAMAAAVTTRLRVGSLVLANDYKHPAVLAKEAATLDLLSDGRLELGIGAGWMTSDYEALGLPYDPPKVRIDRLEEALQVLRGAFRGEPFDFAGEHYTIRGWSGFPKPVQDPLPILIGGGGKRVLSLAARHAQIVGVNPNLRAGVIGPEAALDGTAEKTDEKLGWIRAAAGERFAEIELQVRHFMTVVTDDARGTAEGFAPLFGLEPDAVLDSPVTLIGDRARLVDTLQARRERWGFSYVVVGLENVEAFAPVVADLAGT